jgi:hypothetical protein
LAWPWSAASVARPKATSSNHRDRLATIGTVAGPLARKEISAMGSIPEPIVFLFYIGCGLAGVLFYFLPTVIGRNKRNGAGIFVCNLLFGWTLLGWGVAMIWAVTADTPEDFEWRHYRR